MQWVGACGIGIEHASGGCLRTPQTTNGGNASSNRAQGIVRRTFRSMKMKHLLTRTQTKVVRLISLGCTTRQVASILGISPSTADNHRWQAMRKLGVHTMAGL